MIDYLCLLVAEFVVPVVFIKDGKGRFFCHEPLGISLKKLEWGENLWIELNAHPKIQSTQRLDNPILFLFGLCEIQGFADISFVMVFKF